MKSLTFIFKRSPNPYRVSQYEFPYAGPYARHNATHYMIQYFQYYAIYYITQNAAHCAFDYARHNENHQARL